MATAKDIVLRPIDAQSANDLVRRVHYSGKVVQNSQIHIGVFLDGKLEGAMQFGPSLDKRKIQGLVSGTQWHEFIELNRMAFSDTLPRNSESRALGIAMKLLKKHATQIKWVISFADGTQCGDGTIYRAAGFVLTGIKENAEIWQLSDGRRVASSSVRPGIGAISYAGITEGKSSMAVFKNAGGRKLQGFQLRYIYFIDPSYRARLTVPELPYSEIERQGAGMYKGEKRHSCVASKDSVAAGDQPAEGGANPTATL